jgi:hypothetical protein
MKPIHTFKVRPSLPSSLLPLLGIALALQSTQELAPGGPEHGEEHHITGCKQSTAVTEHLKQVTRMVPLYIYCCTF